MLVVDDEADTRELISTVLGLYKAQVSAASSTAEAFPMLEQLKPNVLVSDIGMPEENGYVLISRVRHLDAERGGNIPAIALTAYAHEEDKRQALKAGFQTHLSKPVEPAELVTVVANLVATAQNR